MLKGDAGDSAVVKEHYRRVRNQLGAVDVLVNNAGIMLRKSFEEISVEDWDETIRINLKRILLVFTGNPRHED